MDKSSLPELRGLLDSFLKFPQHTLLQSSCVGRVGGLGDGGVAALGDARREGEDGLVGAGREQVGGGGAGRGGQHNRGGSTGLAGPKHAQPTGRGAIQAVKAFAGRHSLQPHPYSFRMG